jgi:hypothetical protein
MAPGCCHSTDRDAEQHPFLTLARPRPVTWADIGVTLMAACLVLPFVPYRDWPAELRASAERLDAARLAKDLAAKMLNFFGSLTNAGLGLGLPALSTAKAEHASPTMAQLRERPVGQRDIDPWRAYWKLK